MSDTVAIQKAQLRSQLRQRLTAISTAARLEHSARGCALLQGQNAWQNAGAILFFSPLPSELDVFPLVEAALSVGKIVAFPKFQAESNVYLPYRVENPQSDLRSGKFGIREPADHCAPYSLNQLDLTLVPGLGFDRFGGRLGRGRGFYDKLLVKVRGIKCGVAFDEQVIERVPLEPHDALVDCLLTPTRWIAVRDSIME